MWSEETLPEVRHRLAKYDETMKRRYEEQAALWNIGVDHHFKAGDLVMIRQIRIGKLLPKSLGPFEFVRYRGRLRMVAQVRNPQGKILEYSAGHLIPVVVGTRAEEWELQAARRLDRGSDPPRGGELLTPSEFE